MATFRHAGGDRGRETDGAGRTLGLAGREDLKHRVPVQVDIGIDGMDVIVPSRVHDEAIVGIDISIPPSVISPAASRR